jgi:hypothetical protein
MVGKTSPLVSKPRMLLSGGRGRMFLRRWPLNGCYRDPEWQPGDGESGWKCVVVTPILLRSNYQTFACLAVTMQWKMNAKTQRWRDAKEKGENGSQTSAHRLVTRIGSANFFFAPLRLCVEIPLPYCMDTNLPTVDKGSASLRRRLHNSICVAFVETERVRRGNVVELESAV